MGDPIVQAARGLVLDEANNWEVVAWPFHKFFNSEEGHAAKIDWTTARVQEKVDGSLIIMYYYDGKWQVATSGTPDASGQVNGLGITFEELFWKTFEAQMGAPIEHWNVPKGIQCESIRKGDLPDHPDWEGGVRCVTYLDHYFLPDKLTFMWELTSPYNRIVVQHAKPRITLLGARNIVTGEELDPRDLQRGWWIPPEWPVVKHFDLTSMESIGESFGKMSGLVQEGYVVVDAQFNRVKVKHPQYVALHHLRGEGSNPTPKGALSVIRQGEMGELLSYWPEWKPIFDEVKTRLDTLVGQLMIDYEMIRRSVPPVPAGVVQTDKRAQGLFRKEFANLATKTRVPSVMFSLLDGKADSVQNALAQLSVDHLANILKLDDIVIDPVQIYGQVDTPAPTVVE